MPVPTSPESPLVKLVIPPPKSSWECRWGRGRAQWFGEHTDYPEDAPRGHRAQCFVAGQTLGG